MPIWGDWITTTIASSGTTTDEINLGREFEYLEVRLPTLTSCTLKVQGSNASGGTFQDIGNSVTTGTTTGAHQDMWRIGLWQFVKIVASAAQGATRTIYVRGMRE